MRLKARIRRLQAEVEWLKTWGALRAVELQMEMFEMQREIERVKAERAAEAATRRPAPPCSVLPVVQPAQLPIPPPPEP